MLSEDLQIHRFGMHEPRYRGHRTWWDGEPEFRAHILERLRDEGPLRAREIEDQATVGLGVHRRLDERPHRRPHARHDVGRGADRDLPPRRHAARVGPDGALPAA